MKDSSTIGVPAAAWPLDLLAKDQWNGRKVFQYKLSQTHSHTHIPVLTLKANESFPRGY